MNVEIKYLAWLSTKGGKEELKKNDCIYAGTVRNIPKKYKYLKNNDLRMEYCIITKRGKLISNDMPDENGIINP